MPKTKTEAGKRSVPLLRALPILKRRHLEQGQPLYGWIFPCETRASGHLESVNREFRKARERAGYPKDVVLYTSRHGFAADAAAVLTTKELQGVLGHSDAATTFRYQHQNEQLLQEKLEQAATNGLIQ